MRVPDFEASFLLEYLDDFFGRSVFYDVEAFDGLLLRFPFLFGVPR